jgi:hypothetical protein
LLEIGFEKGKFASSLPTTLVLAADIPLLGGAVGFDFSQTIPDRRIHMHQVWYTTPKRIHGLLHYDGLHQLFFVGYECGQCGKIFLVPDTVEDVPGLVQALRHGCMKITR